jgi:hypothetical protein
MALAGVGYSGEAAQRSRASRAHRLTVTAPSAIMSVRGVAPRAERPPQTAPHPMGRGLAGLPYVPHLLNVGRSLILCMSHAFQLRTAPHKYAFVERMAAEAL